MRHVPFLLLLLAPQAADARETTRMADILASVDRDTLVVFDVDNTLVEPVQTLGSDQWFDHLVKTLERDRSHHEAIDAAMAIWNSVQRSTRVRPVEPETPRIVADLQARGVRMMALTARTLDIADATLAQLRSIGVDFRPTAAHGGELELRSDDVARYTGGVLFVGEKNVKGRVLTQFLEQIRLRPKRVVFVDDKQKHVTSVGAAMAAMGVAYEGFRYGAADARVRGFRAELADVQYKVWRELLSDADAAKLLKAGQPSP